MASPPAHTIDAALPPARRAYGPEGEMGRGLGMKGQTTFTDGRESERVEETRGSL
jgi:hypothetical protein